MLFYNFKNYEEFKELFGTRVCADGNKAQKNKILLKSIKDKRIFHNYLHANNSAEGVFAQRLMKAKNNEDALNILILALEKRDFLKNPYEKTHYSWEFDCVSLYSSRLQPDANKGICIDPLDDNKVGYVRYINCENNRAFKMKAGRFIGNILEEYKYVPLELARYLEERFAREWTAFTSSIFCNGEYTLVVDDDFESIYDSRRCPGNFGSCMTDKDNWRFYENAIDAKAASLRNKDGDIVARCIIYTDAYDQDGERFRLAERQYAKDKSDLLKLQLVNALISGGHIDGYKRVGAGCGDAEDFIGLNGESLSDRMFRISCRLSCGDSLSYQDSFKWYDYNNDVAYNYEDCDYTDELDETNGYFREDDHEDDCWSEYHQEYIDEEGAYYVPSRDDYFYRDEVVRINGDWYFEDDCVRCERCGEWRYMDDCGDNYCYSELTEEYYCCYNCKDASEEEYAESHNMEKCDFDEEWHDKKDMRDIYTFFNSRRICERIYVKEADYRVRRFSNVCFYAGEYYEDNLIDGIPAEFNLKSEIEMW